VAAVLAGARSFTAIGEWAAGAPSRVLAALGVRYDPLAGCFQPPDEATFRRVLEALDAAALEAAVGSWLAARRPASRPPGGPRGPERRAVAVDGKAVRGTRHASADGQAVYLLAAAEQRSAAVLAQAKVDGKTNEITCFAPLLAPLDLAGAVVTADALHAQREHAEFLVTQKKAHYILAVKNNQPSLYAQLTSLPWRDIPAGFDARNKGHARAEWRTLKLTAVAAGIAFPHATQAIQVRRRRRPLNGEKRCLPKPATPSPAWPPARPPPPRSPDGYAATGGSKPSTTSVTPPTVKTPPRSAPGTAPRSWPHCGT